MVNLKVIVVEQVFSELLTQVLLHNYTFIVNILTLTEHGSEKCYISHAFVLDWTSIIQNLTLSMVSAQFILVADPFSCVTFSVLVFVGQRLPLHHPDNDVGIDCFIREWQREKCVLLLSPAL